MRTWKTVTPSVLTTISDATTQLGALVRVTIHSGPTRLISGMNSSMIAFSSARTAYGRSRSTARRGSPLTRVLTATGGTRWIRRAAIRKLSASIANTVRYAAEVSKRSAIPPSRAPTASPALTVDWRNARIRVRSAGWTSPASSA